MSDISTVGYNRVYTHKKILTQENDFTSTNLYQDFLILGIPANHIIMGVKMSVLENFNAGTSNVVTMYVGNSNVFPTPTPYVSNVNNCYGVANLTIPLGSDDSYEYGSFRWFSLSTPGSNSTISTAYCLPQRLDAHDVIARVVVTGSPNILSVVGGAIEITVQYTAL